MKRILILFLLTLPFLGSGQKSYYSTFGINYSNQQELFWIEGISIYNQFGINIKKNLSIFSELKFSYAGADDIRSRNYLSNIIDQKKDYAFGVYPGEKLDNGIITFKKTYSAKYIAFNLDMGLQFTALSKGKHNLDFGLGISLGYIDKMYTGSSIDGEFISVFYGEQSITIISPLFIRYFDIGSILKIIYLYQLNDKVQLGLNCDIINLFNTKYGIYGLGPFVKFTIK